MTRIGTVECLTVFSVTLPNKNLSSMCLPLLAITIKSTSSFSDNFKITSAALPSSVLGVNLT